MILLHSTKYGDSSLILHCYTREGGRRSYLLRGVGKKPVGFLHPLSVLDVVASESSRGKLMESQGLAAGIRYIKEVSPKISLNSLRSNISKNAIAMYISELLYKSLLEAEQDPQLYDFLENSILIFDSLANDFANFHIWFTIQYISRLGFMPRNGYLSEFDPFDPSEKLLLASFLECTNVESTMQITLSGSQRSSFLASLIRYLEYHLGSRLDIKSLGVLHKVVTPA